MSKYEDLPGVVSTRFADMAELPPPFTDVDLTSDNSWGVPDWRDASAYRRLVRLPVECFRWEFTRRNKAYRSFWLGMKGRRFAKGEPGMVFNGQVESESIERFGFLPMSPKFDCFEKEIMLGDPRHDPVDATLFPSLAVPDNPDLFDAWIERGLRNKDVFVRINPSEPLVAQCKNLQAELKYYMADEDEREGLYGLAGIPNTRPETRHRRDKYLLYLRLLDARSGDRGKTASFKEIQKELAKEELVDGDSSIGLDDIKRLCRQARKAQSKLVG